MAKRSAADRELAALSAIMNALQGLDGDSIQRVLDYVFSRLSIGKSIRHEKAHAPAPTEAAADAADGTQRGRRLSIRDLAEQKRPESSNQMAALVAHYLSELADENERKDAINTADISKYFKQAGFRLPKAPNSALPNAAAAGYFDSVGRGLYKLNAVGYNLIVHGLPRSNATAGAPNSRGRTRRKRERASSKGASKRTRR